MIVFRVNPFCFWLRIGKFRLGLLRKTGEWDDVRYFSERYGYQRVIRCCGFFLKYTTRKGMRSLGFGNS